mmetsp:Transcript_8759/g.16565  ORF Transcript_8759/g.16565 Transcript_8759/m.16565 type:complete len:94 (+) Transcript_8759:114-395(+)
MRAAAVLSPSAVNIHLNPECATTLASPPSAIAASARKGVTRRESADSKQATNIVTCAAKEDANPPSATAQHREPAFLRTVIFSSLRQTTKLAA